MSYQQYSAYCHACLQPVPTLASRCPHCTTMLGIAGGRPYDPTQPASTATAVFGWLITYLLVGAILSTWAPEWLSAVWWWPGEMLVAILENSIELIDRLMR